MERKKIELFIIRILRNRYT